MCGFITWVCESRGLRGHCECVGLLRGFVSRLGCVGPVNLWFYYVDCVDPVCGFITWVCESRGLRGPCEFVGLLRGFVSFKLKNSQTGIFKLRGLGICGFVGFAFNLVCGFMSLSYTLK